MTHAGYFNLILSASPGANPKGASLTAKAFMTGYFICGRHTGARVGVEFGRHVVEVSPDMSPTSIVLLINQMLLNHYEQNPPIAECQSDTKICLPSMRGTMPRLKAGVMGLIIG